MSGKTPPQDLALNPRPLIKLKEISYHLIQVFLGNPCVHMTLLSILQLPEKYKLKQMLPLFLSNCHFKVVYTY